jgi:hypothetical protein
MNHRRVELTSLSIGKVARRAGIGVETIRFYEREGLLAAPARRDIGPVHQPETILASLRRSASSDSNAEVDAIRVLPASLPISILAFVLGWQAHRGFVSWAVFALFNGILICRGRR